MTVSVATFMLLLDITVVNTALSAIRDELDASFSDLQWAVDAYTLPLAALVLSAGSLADRLGRRRLFALGLVVFSAASLVAGLAPDPTLLNLGRAVQGAGAATMFAVSLALIAHEFPVGRERGTAMGVYGASIGVAMAVGPLVGGALTDSLGWRSVFLINVPIGAALLAATRLRLRDSRDPSATRVDWAGLTTFSGTLFVLVLALVRANEEGWGSPPIVALLVSAGGLLAAFVAVERRVREPMLPLELFRRRSFTGVQLAAFAAVASTSALYLYLALYLQNQLGHSPLEAGTRFLAIAIPILVVAPLAGALLSRVHPRGLLSAGLVLGGVGLLLMSGLDARSQWTSLLAGFVVAGAGVGLLQPAIAHAAVSVVHHERSGMAAGINNTFRVVGAAVGIAAWGAILLARGSDRVSEIAANTPAATGERPRRLVEAASSGNLDAALSALPAPARETAANAAREGFLAGLNEILALGGGLALAGALLAYWSLREPATATGSRRSRFNAARRREMVHPYP